MKRPYIKPACVIIDMAIQRPYTYMLTGSNNVKDMDLYNEQEVGGDG